MRPNRLRPFTPGAIHHFPYDIRVLRVGQNCWNKISRRLSRCPAICSRICGTSRRSGSPATSPCLLSRNSMYWMSSLLAVLRTRRGDR